MRQALRIEIATWRRREFDPAFHLDDTLLSKLDDKSPLERYRNWIAAKRKMIHDLT
jgi:hypothetical protein